MSGSQELRLRGLVSGADAAPLHSELERWANAAERLRKVGESLLKVAAPIGENLGPQTVESARAAFTAVGTKVNGHSDDITAIHAALSGAAAALADATALDEHQRQHPLGDPPVMRPGTFDEDTVDKAKLAQYQAQRRSYDSELGTRESKSQGAADSLEQAYHEAIALLRAVPDDQVPTVPAAGTPHGPSPHPATPSTPGHHPTPSTTTGPQPPGPLAAGTSGGPTTPGSVEPGGQPTLPGAGPQMVPGQFPPHGVPGGSGGPGVGDAAPDATGTPGGSTGGGPGPIGVVGGAVGAAGAGLLGGLAGPLAAGSRGGVLGGGLGGSSAGTGLNPASRIGGVLGSSNRASGSARGALGSRSGSSPLTGASTSGRGAGRGAQGATGSRGRGGTGGGAGGRGRRKDRDRKRAPVTGLLDDDPDWRDWIDDEDASTGLID